MCVFHTHLHVQWETFHLTDSNYFNTAVYPKQQCTALISMQCCSCLGHTVYRFHAHACIHAAETAAQSQLLKALLCQLTAAITGDNNFLQQVIIRTTFFTQDDSTRCFTLSKLQVLLLLCILVLHIGTDRETCNTMIMKAIQCLYALVFINSLRGKQTQKQSQWMYCIQDWASSF